MYFKRINFKKMNFISFSLGIMLMITYTPGCFAVRSESGSKSSNVTSGKNDYEVLSKEIYVSDIFELLQAVENIRPWGKIFLNNDIDMSGITLYINKSLVLNLNGHSICADQNSGGLVIESKFTVKSKKIIKEYPSDYVWNDDDHKVYKPFFGGDGYNLTVIDHDVKYEYNDDFCVTIQDGSIIRQEGKKGKDGEPGTWMHCSGGRGETPSAPISIKSGVLSLINTNVTGGNGGRGGKGAHYPWPHLPFSGGCGADGGRGGDAGSAISIERSEARLIVDKNSKIEAGLPGEGGEGGEPSDIYWFYKSKAGSSGKPGKSRSNIEYKYKKQM